MKKLKSNELEPDRALQKSQFGPQCAEIFGIGFKK